ncbi:MAG: phosphate ABC transporter permease PstA, partial [Hyphomicrobiales bacterium]|nr:phosphate ABC transporter permease PstA [Hyphomicrobiales bacterium]
MADVTVSPASAPRRLNDAALLKKRYAAEARFKMYGMAAVGFALFFLVFLFWSIISQGWSAFLQTSYTLDVKLDRELIAPDGKTDSETLRMGEYTRLARNALMSALDLKTLSRPQRRDLNGLLSRGVDVQIRDRVLADPSLIGKTISIPLLAHGNVDALLKGSISRKTPEGSRQLNDRQVAWVDRLIEKGIAAKHFNTGLFTYGASSQPETSGLAVALIGSLFMMLTVVLLAVPLGAAAAAYLEEFAPKNRWTDLIEVNINNLAAVPSIVFGLLGLAIFINMFGIPRSASLAGGLVLTLMTLPTIIIATRAAIRAVPPSIREAALGVGASRVQTLFHHTLPLALPGIMTGT